MSFWPLKDMIALNLEYKVDDYAAKFFIIGSDGAEMAYVIERNTGYIFESHLSECQEMRLYFFILQRMFADDAFYKIINRIQSRSRGYSAFFFN